MKISTLNYFIVDAFKSIKRNRTISIAAMITVLITFFVFGTFTLLALNFNKSIEDVASKIQIQVYLREDIKLVDQKEIELKLLESPQVSEVKYESKDEAFLNLKENSKLAVFTGKSAVMTFCSNLRLAYRKTLQNMDNPNT